MTAKHVFSAMTGLAAAVLWLASAPQASALVINFSISGTDEVDFTATGQIVTSDTLNSANLLPVESITGTAGGEAITGFFDPGGLFANALDPTAPFFDQRFQVGFTTADFEFTIGFGANGLEAGTEPLNSDGIFEDSDGTTVVLTEVAEPASLALLAPAFAGLLFWRRRSRQNCRA